MKWTRVKRGSPCPLCGKPDWCMIAPDGQLALCMRVEDGAFRAGKHGGWLHWLVDRDGSASLPTVISKKSDDKVCPLSPAERDKAYRMLLASLDLEDSHIAMLAQRGISEDQANKKLIRSVSPAGLLASVWNESLPGLYWDERDNKPRLTINRPGMLLPIRNQEGMIESVQVRLDRGTPRYLWLSSASRGGYGSGAPSHHLNLSGSSSIILITEGFFKAEALAIAYPDFPVIGLSGVGSWSPARLADSILSTIAQVYLFFDADMWDKYEVLIQLKRLCDYLASHNKQVVIVTWQATHKGVDDYLATGQNYFAYTLASDFHWSLKITRLHNASVELLMQNAMKGKR